MEENGINVLDHGLVKLIQYYGSDDMVCAAARVSVDGGVREGKPSKERDKLLINFLAQKLHTSPFEHCGATIYVKAPIFVLRQWHRHRTHSYNELSGRYSTTFKDYYVPTIERLMTEQTKDSRQGSGKVETEEQAREAIEKIRRHSENALGEYRLLLELGVTREIARIVLPLNTYSEMYDTCNLWNWTRFLKLRLAQDAQYEIRQYAKAILKILSGIFPLSMAAWAKNEGWDDLIP